ncbi:MAG: hypothetical protein HQL08_03650 [Nitrospirae bacterium]|nr:hypothetical protein [Nitrospirota bacterium]
MEFKKILTALLLEMDRLNVPYAIVGAVAMGFWGVRRDTMDIDFLARSIDREKITAVMKGLGYDHTVSSTFADQFVHLIRDMGSVDFLYTKKEKGIIESSRILMGLDGKAIHVALPEDIIGMKLESIRNNPKREMKDWADIQSIVEVLADDLDWEKIKDYCKITGREDAYERILGFR